MKIVLAIKEIKFAPENALKNLYGNLGLITISVALSQRY